MVSFLTAAVVVTLTRSSKSEWKAGARRRGFVLLLALTKSLSFSGS